MRCAVCELSTGLVTNIIVADPNVDPAPEGMQLIEIADGQSCDIGWTWDGTQFNPPLDQGA
jgi:hypothetical protein